MPGLGKIGMTDGGDVQHRMGDLHATGVPLPREHETPVKEDTEQQTET